MAYDLELAERVRDVLGPRPDLTERRMFGGLAFLVRGNITVGIRGDGIIVRVGAEQGDAALARPGVTPFVSRGRAMRGWLVVDGDTVAAPDPLIEWVDLALSFVATLPAS